MLLNNYTQAITAGITDGATVIIVPTPPTGVVPSLTDVLSLTLYDDAGNIEIVKCTQVVGNNLTVTRGAEGTTARAWPLSSTLASRVTAEVLRDLSDVSGVISNLPAVFSDVVTGFSAGTPVPVSSGSNTGIVDGCWDGTHYWLVFFKANNAYTIDQYDIDMVATGLQIPVDVSISVANGITFAHDSFWIGTDITSLYQLDKNTGLILKTITGWKYTLGLTTDGDFIQGAVGVDGKDYQTYNINTETTSARVAFSNGRGFSSIEHHKGQLYGIDKATGNDLREINGLASGNSVTDVAGTADLLVSNDIDIWCVAVGNASIQKLGELLGTVISGERVGILLEVGDSVGSTVVNTVDSDNQVTLVDHDSAGTAVVIHIPSNNDLVTYKSGKPFWK